MSATYTPGLTVSDGTSLARERRLPLPGKVTVQVGQQVRFDSVVAHSELPGRVEIVNVAGKLGLDPSEVVAALRGEVGGPIEKGQPLARNRGFFGFFPATLNSPISGLIESASPITGQVVLRRPPLPVDVKAYIDGVIEEVHGDEGVTVRSFGALIQGIFGIGGETNGPLRILVDSPRQHLEMAMLTADLAGCVVVGGSLVRREFLEQAARLGVSAVVTGGIDDQDLRDFLGYDLGVAITGTEDKGITLILTEGFGPLAMSERTFAILKNLAGQRASVSGATQIRAGVIRPEIIVPLLQGDWQAAPTSEDGGSLQIGGRVRIIREPHFGEFATIRELPPEPQLIPTEALVRVAVIELENGTQLALPRANLERVS